MKAAEQPTWHSEETDAILAKLEVTDQGLTSEQALGRLERHGYNLLPAPARSGPFRRFVLQFHNVLIYVLLAAALSTGLLRHWVDTFVILGVVLINAVVGFIQEGKAEQALKALRDMLSPKALVLRDGQRRTVPAEELVPGDLVFLQAGDRVPADLRLLRSHNMRIDEAMLTGESVAVDKRTTAVERNADLGDRKCMAFSGTLVAFGQGQGVVVGTGANTQIGHISTLLGEVETLTTPLLRDIATFGRWLTVAIVVLAAVTFAFGYWVHHYDLLETFLAAVSLAVAAIPEGLPAIMTITLAIGVQRMAARNAIIRRLPAVETLGSVTIICSDKTGTLTRNEMTVKTLLTAEESYEVSGVGYEPHGGFSCAGEDVEPGDHPVLAEALRGVILCNDAQIQQRDGRWHLEGDPTEGALVVAGLKAGLDSSEVARHYPRDDVIPFESQYKFMATLHHHHEGHQRLLFLKGAPERVLALCDRERTPEGDRPLSPQSWERRMDEIAARGQRLLAVAVKTIETETSTLSFPDVEGGGLTLVAVCGLIDPPRDEAIAAVKECQQAGIVVKMITGDHAVTAQAIADELGIRTAGGVVPGHELEEVTDAELKRLVHEVDVFARTTPEHKLRLVRALQASGQVVAMTGDGVNDAPALKRADVGVAMGIKGSEAAREAAAMVLADDNFASIAHAVEEGRTVYDNLRKAILYILPTSGGEALTIMAAVLMGMTLPLLPAQVLWVNMVTAVTLSLALAFEPAEPGVMRRRPRPPGTPVLSGFLIWRVTFVSLLLLAGTFGHFLWMDLQGAPIELARTVAINALVMGEIAYLFNSRYILAPTCNRAGLLGSRAVLLAVGALLILQGLFTYAPPLQLLFGTAPLAASEWVSILAFGVTLFAVVELEKAIVHRWSGTAGASP
ncbi:cation-transporting P-type ATPase [Marinobacter bryozoorum]|uniref:cation-transporting P-type ATPase n=1 Tax=Marinobacter bryozoorum TaxID=256324 RepID=UPI0020036041|nr:cation-transporting P-type ATPase [Marinobacter bryozoorum]MCK7545576.1 cation-transporting P-type ATPase [Marinobacter bryozoorum]